MADHGQPRRRARSAALRPRLPDPLRRHRARRSDGQTPADGIRTAADLADHLRWWRGQNPTTRSALVADALDGQHGRLLWDVEAGGVVAGGLDVVDVDGGGRVSWVWSLGGQRSVRR